MSRYHSYINSAIAIINEYDGAAAFASFLKKHFSVNKKYGSKDRKQISNLCYCFFRLGKMQMELSTSERILLGLFLCSDKPNKILEALKPEWDGKMQLSIDEKCSVLNDHYSILNVFPWKDKLSDGIDHLAFARSFFLQPNLFLRLRPGMEKIVQQKLTNAGIDFTVVSSNCLALTNAAKVDKVIELNKEAVVQDYSSQQTADLLKNQQAPILNHQFSVWDCCAASGGKSIMLKDVFVDIELTVSDIRESILVNLKKRFKEAGIVNYKSFVANLSNSTKLKTENYDFIIADVPCSGSGTWSRTPEQLYFFDEKKIAEYAVLQKKILANVIPCLKTGGYFLYVTCSVFANENEDAIMFIKEKAGLDLLAMNVIKGYDKKADSMFAALLRKPL